MYWTDSIRANSFQILSRSKLRPQIPSKIQSLYIPMERKPILITQSVTQKSNFVVGSLCPEQGGGEEGVWYPQD